MVQSILKLFTPLECSLTSASDGTFTAESSSSSQNLAYPCTEPKAYLYSASWLAETLLVGLELKIARHNYKMLQREITILRILPHLYTDTKKNKSMIEPRLILKCK